MISAMSLLSPRATLVSMILIVQAALAVSVAYVCASVENTLLRNGKWTSTKLALEKQVMSALVYMNSRQALSGERLNLGRWHGYQEVIYHEALPLRDVSFDLLLPEQSYLTFVFGKTQERFRGILLGTPPFSSLYFTALDSGEFLSSAPLPDARPKAGVWTRLTVEFAGDHFSAALDGVPVASFPMDPMGMQRFGFRGCAREVFVDDLVVHRSGPGGTVSVIRETFWNGRGFALAFASVAAALLLLDLLALLVYRGRGARGQKPLFAALAASLLLLVAGAAVVAVYVTRFSGSYGVPDAERERAWRAREAQRINEALSSERQALPEGGDRVLFVGSSQTWGAGATREEDTFVHAIESRLAVNDPPIECINAGVSGLTAGELFRLYREEWLSFAPRLTVINLSTNDEDAAAFEQALEQFVALNEEHGVATLFVLEPNSTEFTPRSPRLHPVMRRVAERHAVPVVDAHAYLAERSDRGFLWWDVVHPTSFGHRLIAECLAEEIRDAVRGFPRAGDAAPNK